MGSRTSTAGLHVLTGVSIAAVAAAVLLLRFRVNSAWLVAGGAAVGLIARFALWA